jgi:hypothetical protein
VPSPLKSPTAKQTVHWRCSGARNYAGIADLVGVITDPR